MSIIWRNVTNDSVNEVFYTVLYNYITLYKKSRIKTFILQQYNICREKVYNYVYPLSIIQGRF